MKPQRITLSRKAGWRMPANTVKVTRPGKWGNPFKVSGVLNAEDAVEMYKRWLNDKSGEGWLLGPVIRRDLKGKNLACWCKQGEPCHADVLLELANA